jgi:hypothetical protein
MRGQVYRAAAKIQMVKRHGGAATLTREPGAKFELARKARAFDPARRERGTVIGLFDDTGNKVWLFEPEAFPTSCRPRSPPG